MYRYAIFLMLIVTSVLTIGNFDAFASPPEIQRLKNLHIETPLVKNGVPAAVIVAPQTGFLGKQANELAAKVFVLTGAPIEIVSDEVAPEELLKRKNVIAIGNMATNRFIEHLYRQWHVILDRTYPGKGGYVVRSLHNPYGTSCNVIFVGGSDDDGVTEAVRVFIDLLKPKKRDSLSVGWLMKIKLGQGMNPPSIGAFMPKWQVSSWDDSWRKTSTGRETGYAPATFFGWNPISIAGVLYYMTGKREYLDCFKVLALPDPLSVPLVNLSSDAFTDPLNPLVKNNHYRAHLVPFVYDLIEESPLFSDSERLLITKKLHEQQVDYDPNDTYAVANGDRHAQWHLLTIYAGSRYFATYYPDPAWERRVGNVRTSFRSFFNNPTWGTRDTLYWVATSIEPLFEFFLLDGFDEFLRSGTARTMMKALEILMTGDEIDNANQYLSIGLLHKAAYLTGDSRYLWMRGQLGYDLSGFRIGQSFWPTDNAEITPPDALVNAVSVYPLAHADWQEAKTPVPEQDSFQILSYRTGLKKSDDYLLMDGFEGRGRHLYELNTISRLRLFGGKNVLVGPANGISIWHNGMADGMAARSAALATSLANADLAYIRTEVPDMPSARWQRNVLTLKNMAAIVIDRVESRRKGHFDIVCSWQPGSTVKSAGLPVRRLVLANGVVMTAAESPYEKRDDGVIRENVSRPLAEGEALTLGTLFTQDIRPVAIRPVAGGYLLTGGMKAFVAAGRETNDELFVQSEFVYLDRQRLVLADGTSLVIGGESIVAADKPVSLAWDFTTGELMVSSRTAAHIKLATAHGTVEKDALAGECRLQRYEPPKELGDRISECLQRFETVAATESTLAADSASQQANWVQSWELDLKDKVSALAVNSRGGNESIWVVSQGKESAEIAHLDKAGRELGKNFLPGELLSLWMPQNDVQAKAFGLLAGFKDDLLFAFDDQLREIWHQKTEISPEFRIGDHYNSPWFTDPAVLSGVSSILVGEFGKNGEQEIIIGRPSTLEFRTLSGDLTARVSNQWGTNSALAFLQTPGFFNRGKVLIAGKSYTGNPTVTAISREYTKISDGYFAGLPSGFADMHAWMQRGMGQMAVSDLGNTGIEQVVFTLSGHWNELRVYDGYNNSPRWMKSFGPDRVGGGFMRGLQVLDLDGSGKKAVVVATRTGWLSAFDYQGNTLWQRRFASEITAMSANETRHRIVVGCADGTLFLLDGTGTNVAVGTMGMPVQSLAFGSDFVIVGGSKGLLRKFLLRLPP